MEFLEGRELKDLMAAREVTTERALDIAAQVADGLAYAHARGVVHRDVKPANIMILHDGRVKITDFGIARMRTAEVRTQTGVVLGSPRYLSPEQVLGKRCDARADIFSLGVIVYEMVTGHAPFKGNDVHSLMFQIVNLNPTPPSAVNPALPPMLDLIIAKALAKDPDERYAGIADLASDLRACRQQAAAATASVPAPVVAAQRAIETVSDDPYVDTFPLSRGDDLAATLPGNARPARGLAKGFDSMAATMRLAGSTGALGDFSPRHPADAGIPVHEESANSPGETIGIHTQPWSQRDRSIFLGAAIGATVLGAVIVFI